MKLSKFNPANLGKTILKQLIPNAGSVILALLIFWAASVYASPGRAPAQSVNAVPNIINYQGRLADASGNPVDNTNPGLGITFSLYTQQSGGSAVWSETHANTPVSQGLFSVKLGSITPLTNDLLTGDLWLGIQVGADAEMTPREKLSAVPYAMIAGEVRKLPIQSGELSKNSGNDPNWGLHKGTGPRRYSAHVTFNQSFSSVPIVKVSLRGADVYYGHNFRLDVWAENVTQDGFDLVYSTWSDSFIYGATATWIAYETE